MADNIEAPNIRNVRDVIPIILVCVATCIGAALRFVTLTVNSIWLDEGATWMISTMSYSDIFWLTFKSEFNPPTLYLMLHPIIETFGASEFTLRIIPCIAGILTIPAIYYLGKEMYDWRAGCIAAIFLALSPWHIAYSQEARAYTLAILCFTIACIYWYRSMSQPLDIRWYLWFAVAAAASIWMHYYSAVFVAILAVFGFIILWRAWTITDDVPAMEEQVTPVVNWVLASGAIGVFISPMIVAIILTVLYRVELSTGALFGVVGPYVVSETFYQLSGFSWVTAVVLILWTLAGCMLFVTSGRTTAALMVGGSIILAFVIAMGVAPYINIVPRYLCCMVPLWLVAAGSAISWGADRVRTMNIDKILAVCLVAFLIITTIPSLVSVMTVPYKNDWRGAAAYIDENIKDGDTIVFVPSYIEQPFTMYAQYTERVTKLTQHDFDATLEIKNGTIYYLVSTDVYPDDVSEHSWVQSHSDTLVELTGVVIGVRNASLDRTVPYSWQWYNYTTDYFSYRNNRYDYTTNTTVLYMGTEKGIYYLPPGTYYVEDV